ncbi:MAG: hypothetical protein Q9208_003299 [Pyrenodesmia sp. 3 TL-2023]
MPFPPTSPLARHALSAFSFTGTVLLIGIVKAKCPKPTYRVEHKISDLGMNGVSGIGGESKDVAKKLGKEVRDGEKKGSGDWWSPSA